MSRRECPCGSGLFPQWSYDAQNIPLCLACAECREKKLAKYRPEILTGYNQLDVDEQIDGD